ncbi:RtcB family protein [Thermoplasma sp.]|uniref:RtcB family protein n=1 Tax=Thermoplasma sp. TaxID=1973142 RepID=UPI001283B251|nr:RtcB family protein [Thermoplasma sp.]KAA8922004.1 MAG: RtcB family protein [Thermoplasma sp.]
MNVRRIDDYTYIVDKEEGMNVPGIVYSSEELFKSIDDGSLRQVINVAKLPGIVKASYAMPDIHLGYGFPIGGVAAFDANSGIISPGGVGYDINCGVALVSTGIKFEEFKPKVREVTDDLFNEVPSGLTSRKGLKVSSSDLNEILRSGLKWAYEHDLATREDMDHTEDGGSIENTGNNVSKAAQQRGISQIGTLGAGNHFLEVQRVSQIFDNETAKKFGIEMDEVTVMVHTGSRGLGHQVATDYIRMLRESDYAIKTSDPELISVPAESVLGEKYLDAMRSAANFAFVNRQIAIHRIREVFEKHFDARPRLVYSLAHNIAKEELHMVDGERMKLIVHRKGATRAFPAGKASPPFEDTGHPVLIPGSMGTASYVLVGLPDNLEKSFGTTCHGSGRVLSRNQAVKKYAGIVEKELEQRNVYARPATKHVLYEEAPESYKNVDDVVDAVYGARLAKPVVKMIPISVVKG